MAALDLPFERGTTLDSGSFGPVPNSLIGMVFVLADGTKLQICKNVDPAALVGGRLNRLNATAGSALVNENSGAAYIAHYGVTDPTYADKAVTVPANALFYNQMAGLTRIRVGASTAAGVTLIGHATDGHVGVGTLISNGAAVVVGLTLATAASGALIRALLMPRI